MPYYFFQWNDLIEGHLAANGVSAEEFERIVCDPESIEPSRSSEREVAFGTVDGRFLACVYEFIDATTILPVTAFEVE